MDGVNCHILLINLLSVGIYRFQNVVLRCPTPRLHCFLSSHWPSFRFLSFMAFLIPSIQIFFGLPLALLCSGIHFNAVLGNLLLPFFEHGDHPDKERYTGLPGWGLCLWASTPSHEKKHMLKNLDKGSKKRTVYSAFCDIEF